MRYARKKRKLVHAYRLGDGSPMERQLLQEGAIKQLPDGSYEIFSQESTNGHGEIARAGDYIKVDSVDGHHFPYPNAGAYFLKNHRPVAGDLYEQISPPVAIWEAEDAVSEEIRYLLQTGQLRLNEAAPESYFNAHLWGAPLSAPKDAVVAFYSVERDESGAITDIEFNFIQRPYFLENYEWVE